MPKPINDDESLWTSIDLERKGGFLRQFRYTACPVMGDDDVVDEEDEDEDRDADECGEHEDDGKEDEDKSDRRGKQDH